MKKFIFILCICLILGGCGSGCEGYTKKEWTEGPKKGLLPRRGWTRYLAKIVEAHNVLYYKIIELEKKMEEIGGD